MPKFDESLRAPLLSQLVGHQKGMLPSPTTLFQKGRVPISELEARVSKLSSVSMALFAGSNFFTPTTFPEGTK
jgi:hypothetical protein